MIKKFFLHFFPLWLLIVSACGTQPLPTSSTEPPLPTATNEADDPCSSTNLPDTVQGINDLMREFDDAAGLAANLPAQQLPDIISNLQRIRRAAEDVEIPACLKTLKTHQLNHMNLTIQTLLAFVGGANQDTLQRGMEMARQEHNLYSLEIVRLLGITLAPVTATPPSAQETPVLTNTP